MVYPVFKLHAPTALHHEQVRLGNERLFQSSLFSAYFCGYQSARKAPLRGRGCDPSLLDNNNGAA
jgi:hypothetical protein